MLIVIDLIDQPFTPESSMFNDVNDVNDVNLYSTKHRKNLNINYRVYIKRIN